MSEEKQGKWKERLAKIGKKVADKVGDVLGDVWDKVAKELGPEVWAFVIANREIIQEAVLDTALHYAEEPDHIKFETTLKRLKDELMEAAGDGGENIEIPDSVLGFAIHFAILLLKRQGKM